MLTVPITNGDKVSHSAEKEVISGKNVKKKFQTSLGINFSEFHF